MAGRFVGSHIISFDSCRFLLALLCSPPKIEKLARRRMEKQATPTQGQGRSDGNPKIPRHGGLRHLGISLRILDDANIAFLSDIIFVSIDLEISRSEREAARNARRPPHIKEFGIASLDTRDIFCSDAPRPGRLIKTRQFSTSNASKDFENCDTTDFQECVFAETFLVSQQTIAATIKSCLCIQDNRSPGIFRQLVLVGHSIKHDLSLLQHLDLDIFRIAPIVSIFDTHAMSRHLFGSQSTWSAFSLGAALDNLECSYNAGELHNAGNDATFTLHVMLALAIKHAETRQLTVEQAEKLELVKVAVQPELDGSYRWKPIRLASKVVRLQ